MNLNVSLRKERSSYYCSVKLHRNIVRNPWITRKRLVSSIVVVVEAKKNKIKPWVHDLGERLGRGRGKVSRTIVSPCAARTFWWFSTQTTNLIDWRLHVTAFSPGIYEKHAHSRTDARCRRLYRSFGNWLVKPQVDNGDWEQSDQ